MLNVYATSPAASLLRREPSCAGFHVDCPSLTPDGDDIDQPKHNRQHKSARPDGTRIENCDPSVDADEWYVRVAADDQRGALGLANAGDWRTQLRAVAGDMRRQDSQRRGRRDVKHERVGQIVLPRVSMLPRTAWLGAIVASSSSTARSPMFRAWRIASGAISRGASRAWVRVRMSI
jgi:hypothetical protein